MGGIGFQSRFRIEYRGQVFVLHFDQLDGLGCQAITSSRHGSYGLAYMPHPIGGKDQPVLYVQTEKHTWRIGAGDNGFYPLQRQCPAGVDPENAGMGTIAIEDFAIEHARPGKVGAIDRLPGDFFERIDARDRLANDGVFRLCCVHDLGQCSFHDCVFAHCLPPAISGAAA